jgi:hypothetical protein
MRLQGFAAAASSYVAFSSALHTVWRAVSDRDGICRVDEAAARAWLLPKIGNALSVPERQCKIKVIDETCEMMAGGPLKGFWVDAIQSTRCATQHG